MQLEEAIVLVGAPNVGKSMLFNYLTGMYATVSNYPGTTVDLSCGQLKFNREYSVIDTPGIYSLIPLTAEEHVTRDILCQTKAKLVIQVIDAKQLRRMLNLTYELLDGGFPLIVVINMIDEAERLGIQVDVEELSLALGVPVVATAAVNGYGLSELVRVIANYCPKVVRSMKFDKPIEVLVDAIMKNMNNSNCCGMSSRLAAVLLLQGDPQLQNLVRTNLAVKSYINQAKQKIVDRSLLMEISRQRQNFIDQLLAGIIKNCANLNRESLISKLLRRPITGVPILLLVLYLGLYWFVGRFGAGVAVDYINKVIFLGMLLPVIKEFFIEFIPVSWLYSLLFGEFGVISLGLRYAIAIILPVVSSFFLLFAVLEDSGYLPRLSMLLNRMCRFMGLNGRAVIPLSLGLGCGTMAVMVTRTLETKRERLLATFLLAIAIPCSAQLGVIMALLSHNVLTLSCWFGVVTLVFFAVGVIANRILPGECSPFYLELPPLRLPQLRNVLQKAYHRMVWYMQEIIPVFIGVSIILGFIDRWGGLEFVIAASSHVFIALGLPAAIAPVFLLGFFRRDYGSAGLYDLMQAGLLDEKQLLIAAIALTLFVPCVAQTMVMIKERGFLTSTVILVLVVVIAIAVAWVVNLIVEPRWLY